MKLYTTVSSERASKGQGGNEYIETVLTVERADKSRVNILTSRVEPHELGYSIVLKSMNGDELYRDQYIDNTKKGEKQKGEIRCPNCNQLIWDTAKGHKLNKCWNCNTAFDE